MKILPRYKLSGHTISYSCNVRQRDKEGIEFYETLPVIYFHSRHSVAPVAALHASQVG
jgi:hypothetical protein